MSEVWKRTHPTCQCPIKERQENPFCINYQEYSHSVCYTKCPEFPKPKKSSPRSANKTFESIVGREGVSFANVVRGTVPPIPVTKLTEKINENSNKVFQGIQLNENNNSDLAQVHHPENDQKSDFPASRFLRKALVTFRVIDSRTELSVKVAAISHLGYLIQIARLKIRQGPSFRTPRFLS
ncbi:hypothetical protein TNCV_3258451 [Trichonephila clavipes]|nr:hypothetical protein TNCV_3258451 [Trichonephila clavipes]